MKTIKKIFNKIIDYGLPTLIIFMAIIWLGRCDMHTKEFIKKESQVERYKICLSENANDASPKASCTNYYPEHWDE